MDKDTKKGFAMVFELFETIEERLTALEDHNIAMAKIIKEKNNESTLHDRTT